MPPAASPSFDVIQQWVSDLSRQTGPDAVHTRPGNVHLAFCLAQAFHSLGVEVVEVAPVVCLHAPHPNPGNLCVRTSWSYYARLEGRLFGLQGEITAEQAAAPVAAQGQRWLLPLTPEQYELRTPQRVMPLDEWQPMFGNLWQEWETAMIERLRERLAVHLAATTLSDVTPTIRARSTGSLRL